MSTKTLDRILRGPAKCAESQDCRDDDAGAASRPAPFPNLSGSHQAPSDGMKRTWLTGRPNVARPPVYRSRTVHRIISAGPAQQVPAEYLVETRTPPNNLRNSDCATRPPLNGGRHMIAAELAKAVGGHRAGAGWIARCHGRVRRRDLRHRFDIRHTSGPVFHRPSSVTPGPAPNAPIEPSVTGRGGWRQCTQIECQTLAIEYPLKPADVAPDDVARCLCFRPEKEN